MSRTGSSPRMRGTPKSFGKAVSAKGIIPAHAGNTYPHCCRPSLHRDHPRACGEHPRSTCLERARSGSSPRMRGTLWLMSSGLVLPGIIPAHAGNTNSAAPKDSSDRDHPRACGEHRLHGIAKDYCRGSSPRMRGTRRASRIPHMQDGIIPAHAGNTEFRHTTWLKSRDHPRACGEHPRLSHRRLLGRGSSPRMRGTQNVYLVSSVFAGIIPAHAGNTPRDRRRSGGDTGIIPAHAGNTIKHLRRNHNLRDHPRACGEHIVDSRYRSGLPGSSPRMRGTPR